MAKEDHYDLVDLMTNNIRGFYRGERKMLIEDSPDINISTSYQLKKFKTNIPLQNDGKILDD